MKTPLKTQPGAPIRKPASPGRDRVQRRSAQISAGEGHIGATEDEVSATMPPKPDDDEPKQG